MPEQRLDLLRRPVLLDEQRRRRVTLDVEAELVRPVLVDDPVLDSGGTKMRFWMSEWFSMLPSPSGRRE